MAQLSTLQYSTSTHDPPASPGPSAQRCTLLLLSKAWWGWLFSFATRKIGHGLALVALGLCYCDPLRTLVWHTFLL